MKEADKCKQWIEETQMFQRIAGIKESSFEDLEADWKSFNKKQREFNSRHTSTHLTILKMGKEAGKNRRN